MSERLIAETPLQGAKVLLMEDEFLVAMALQSLLEDLGCEVIGPFASVSAGVELATAARLDAAVLDVNLRDGLVTPVAERLAARGVPVVLHTAYSAAALPASLQTFDRMAKPCSEAALKRGLLTLLQHRRQAA